MPSYQQIYFMDTAGWLYIAEGIKRLTNDEKYFDVTILFNMILGFANYYRIVVVNANYELILIRSRSSVIC